MTANATLSGARDSARPLERLVGLRIQHLFHLAAPVSVSFMMSPLLVCRPAVVQSHDVAPFNLRIVIAWPVVMFLQITVFRPVPVTEPPIGVVDAVGGKLVVVEQPVW